MKQHSKAASNCTSIFSLPGRSSSLSPHSQEAFSSQVEDMFTWLVQPCLDFNRMHGKFVVQTSPIHLAFSMMRLYSSLLGKCPTWGWVCLGSCFCSQPSFPPLELQWDQMFIKNKSTLNCKWWSLWKEPCALSPIDLLLAHKVDPFLSSPT